METSPSKLARAPGLLLVYTGNGKGKTTAALGLVMRALGRKLRVGMIQFIKGKWVTGERLMAQTLPGLTFEVMGKGFTWESDDLSIDKRAAQAAWTTGREMIESGQYDLVVLDEITYAINYDFISGDEVVQTLKSRPAHVHVCLTGRNAPQALLDTADLVSEMRAIKHPYESGKPAAPGIDF